LYLQFLHDDNVCFKDIEHRRKCTTVSPWLISKWIPNSIDIPGRNPNCVFGNHVVDLSTLSIVVMANSRCKLEHGAITSWRACSVATVTRTQSPEQIDGRLPLTWKDLDNFYSTIFHLRLRKHVSATITSLCLHQKDSRAVAFLCPISVPGIAIQALLIHSTLIFTANP
jgi:hypothetical protein